MSEIEFFAVDEEIIELVRWLLDRRCEFIPDLHYDTGTFDRIRDLQTMQSLAKSVAQFYVVRQDMIESPLELREVTTADKHFFYIDPRTGGPTLLFNWGRQFARDGRSHLSTTDLSYYPWYENSLSHIREKPAKAFRNLYTEFAKAVRHSRRKIKPGKREFWISPKVEELVRKGLVLVGLEDVPADQILGVPGQSKLLDREEVHLIIDYWDGPREGVADYCGTPHYFRALFDEKRDEWSDVFILSPLDLDTYHLLIERNEIWERWQEAYETGAATIDSHPALPEDTDRSKELAEIIERKTEIDPITAIRLTGSFEADDRTKPTSNRKWRVRWLPID
jgi:hypothetical protein